MKALVIGGAGFIGSNLCLSLLRDGYEVSVIDDLSTGRNYKELAGLVHSFRKIDITEEGFGKYWMGLPFKNADVVYNLVGSVSHINSMAEPLKDLKANVAAPISVLELVRKNCPETKVIYTGTRGQYGKIQYLPVDENHPLTPVDVNGVSKNAAEQFHFLYSRQYGLDVVSLRLTNIFGPRHQTETQDGVLNWFITQALRGEKISICGGDRDIVFVDECVDALKRAARLDKSYSGQAFNIGGRKVSLKDYVETVVKVVPTEFEVVEKENKLEIGDYLADASKFISATGWALSDLSVEEMIRKTVDFYNKMRL